MKYSFDEVIDRKSTNSYKWDSSEYDNNLPMWVADMDFKTAQPIIDALANRVQHGIFGYTKVPNTYYEAVINWFSKYHNFTIDKNYILYTTGVVPALSAIIKALTKPGDKVIVQNPAYNCFFSSIRNNDCVMVANDLLYKDGRYIIDFEDLNKKASDPDTKLLLLCNPHNPVGRSWTRDELIAIGTICRENNVFIISDEIHCDLVYTEKGHIPFASICDDFLEHSLTCIAPSKTFNLAGLQVANIVVKNTEVRKKIDKALNINEVCEINPFAVEAVIAAYNYGDEWLSALKTYLQENYKVLKTFFKDNLKPFTILPLEATYLVWVDCSVLKQESVLIADFLNDNQHIQINPGTLYGESGEGFIRINIACPKETLTEGLNRLNIGLNQLLDLYLK